KYVNEALGVNSRLDEIQAAVLRVKLGYLDEWNRRRSEVAERYLAELAHVDDLTLPRVEEGSDPSWHLFVVRHPQRDLLQSRLAAQGVQSLIHYPIPPHRQAAYADLPVRHVMPVAELLADQVLSLPIGPHLSDAEVDRVIRAVR